MLPAVGVAILAGWAPLRGIGAQASCAADGAFALGLGIGPSLHGHRSASERVKRTLLSLVANPCLALSTMQWPAWWPLLICNRYELM